MGETISGNFVVRLLLVLAPLDREQKEQTLRLAVEALSPYDGERFVGDDRRSREFIAGGRAGADMVVRLRHARFDELSDEDNGWIKIAVSDDGVGKPAYLFVSLNIGREEQLDLQWRVALEFAPRLVAALKPSVAFVNGKLIDDEHYQALPAPKDFNRAGPPTAITPWTYIEEARLHNADLKRQIASLPLVRSFPLEEGLAIQVVDRLEDEPSPEFPDALARIRPPRIRYLAPQLSAE